MIALCIACSLIQYAWAGQILTFLRARSKINVIFRELTQPHTLQHHKFVCNIVAMLLGKTMFCGVAINSLEIFHLVDKVGKSILLALADLLKGEDILFVKMRKNFLNRMLKNSPKNSLPLPRNPKRTKMISLSYDTIDHVNLF